MMYVIESKNLKLDVFKSSLNDQRARQLENIHRYLMSKNVQLLTHTCSPPEPITLEQNILCVLHSMNEAFKRTKKIPPATSHILFIVDELIKCTNKKECMDLIISHKFQYQLNIANKKINDMNPNRDIFLGCLKLLAAPLLFVLGVTALFYTCLFIGFFAGAISPIYWSLAWFDGSAIFSLAVAGAGVGAWLFNGIDQLRTALKVKDFQKGFSLFSGALTGIDEQSDNETMQLINEEKSAFATQIS